MMPLVLIALIAYAVNSHAATVTNTAASNTERNIFAMNLYQAVANDNPNKNVVLSPAAVQTTMALAYYGAKGKTATEMKAGLALASADGEEVVRRFGEFQQTFARDNNIRLATNIYINENLEFKAKFREIAQRNFDADVEKADFHPPYNRRTADRINKAFEDKTNGKITNIISPDQLNDRTEGIILNAITYSAPWQKAFKADKTTKRSFSDGGRQSFEVDTMWTLNNFKYAEFGTLDAKVVELPYQNNDFSMLVILPNKKDGLTNLVRQLSGGDLITLLANNLSTEKVEIHLPKFSVAYNTNLEEPFRLLGVTTMFSREGDFGNLFRMFVNHHINSANHKAYVEVSEAGVEQPLESGGLKNLFSRSKKFNADHPFLFAIKNKDSIIFIGHISNYAYV